MRCTAGEVDMMEVPLPVYELAAPPPHPGYAAHDDENTAPPSPTPGVSPGGLGPLFQQGFVDCAQEALRFLMEEEGFSADHPLVTGLKQHLLHNAVPGFGVPSQGYPPAMAASHPAFWSSGAPHRVGGKHSQSQDTRGKSEQCTSPVLTELSPISHNVPSVNSTTSSSSEGLLTESDLAGVLSCLTYIHPGPARASHDLQQHSCHQIELLPARGRELSFTSSESDADSSLNVTSVSDSGDLSVTLDSDMAVADSDSVFVSCENQKDSATGAADSGAVTDLAAERTNAHTTVSVNSERQSVLDCNASTVTLPPLSSLQTSIATTTALETTSSQTTTEVEAWPAPHTLPPITSVPPVSLFPSFLAAPGVGLSPEEVRIRTLAHEILALLQEEALDGSDAEDDDFIDDAYDFEDEAEDMVIEIEQ